VLVSSGDREQGLTKVESDVKFQQSYCDDLADQGKNVCLDCTRDDLHEGTCRGCQ